MIIDNEFDRLVKTPSDINEHLVALKDLASKCEHITEMGVRYLVSTYAFLAGLPVGGKLLSIDIKHPKLYQGDLEKAIEGAGEKGVMFDFLEGDTTKIEINPTDLLFIDTDHVYPQLKKELELHADKARKYIAFHDTTSCEAELWPAIEEFLVEHPEWKILYRYTNNNGITILEK